MANEDKENSSKDNEVPKDSEQVPEGLSAEDAAEPAYDEKEAWDKSKNTLFTILGAIALGVAGVSFYNQSDQQEETERNLRYLTASSETEGAEERFLSFSQDYDDKLGGLHKSDLVIIAAKTKNGVSLFTVDRDSDGIEINQTKMVDSRNAANITFKNLEINSDAILGELDSAQDIINEVLDISRAVLAAEMLGGALEAFEITLNYLKEREQFGAKIGSFQALQHRAANMFTELELCKSCVLESLSAFEEKSNDIQRLVSLSKAKVGETFHLVSNEGVQMHGGVGVTDEYDIGLYLKRARVAEQTFGNSEFHRNRYAEITGY